MNKAPGAHTDNSKSSLPLAGWKLISLNAYGKVPITGGEIYNYQIIRSLLDKGASIYSLKFPLKKGKDAISIRSLIASILWLCRLLPLDKKSIVATDNFYAPLVIIPFFILRIFTPVKIMVFNHTTRTNQNPLKIWLATCLEKLVIRTGHIVFVNSQMTYDLLGMSKVKSKVYSLPPPLIVKSNFVDRRNRKRSFVSLLFVGSIVKNKGLHVIIESLTLCNNIKWRLRIVGDSAYDPGYFENCQQLIKENKLNDRITFLGFLGSELVEKEYINADIFLLPSRDESYGMTYVEAAANSLPIISTNTGVVKELFTHGENVWIVPPGNIQALAEAITRLAKDKELRFKLGKKAYGNIDHSYGPEQMCKRAEEILIKAMFTGRAWFSG